LNPPRDNGYLIKAENLSRVYHRGQEKVEALKEVSLNLPFHSFAVILGPSGGGKSTLLHLLGGMDRPTSGSLSINGFDLVRARESSLTSFRRDNIGFIFQFYNLLPSLSALDNVILPLLAKGRPLNPSREKAKALLEQVGLTDRILHRPGQLSGGEQQRVAIARAIIVEPLLVLADEPTGDLDSSTAREVIELMAEMNRKLGVTFIVATHNQLIASYASHHFAMRDGRLTREPGAVPA
jgi:ABC-type lipoprotein export system ATPase subunit